MKNPYYELTYTACPAEALPIYDPAHHVTVNSDDEGYIDVYVNGRIAYMDGEECKVVGWTPTEVILRNPCNNTGEEIFTISRQHFEAVFVKDEQ